jgi:hypothetical protein
LSRDVTPRGLSTDPHPPFLVYVVIGCPYTVSAKNAIF